MKSKNILVLVLMIAGVVVSGLYGPWWAPAVFVVLLSALMRLPISDSLWTGAISMLLVFSVMSMMMLGKDASGLIGKTGTLLGGLSSSMMVIVTGIIGGVTGLFAGWLGSGLGKVVSGKN